MTYTVLPISDTNISNQEGVTPSKERGIFEKHQNSVIDNIKNRHSLIETKDDEYNKVNPIPNIWSRAILFDIVLKNEQNKQYNYVYKHWKLLLAKLALREFKNLDLELTYLDLSDNNDFDKVLKKQIPNNKINGTTWDKRIYLILEKGQAIGLISPSTLVCTGVNYEIPLEEENFIETLSNIEKKVFALWLIELRKNLKDETINKSIYKYISEIDKNLLENEDKLGIPDSFYSKHIYSSDKNTINFDNNVFSKLNPIDVNSFLLDELILFENKEKISTLDGNSIYHNNKKYIPILPFNTTNLKLLDVEKKYALFSKQEKDIYIYFDDIVFENNEENNIRIILTLKTENKEIQICKYYYKDKNISLLEENEDIKIYFIKNNNIDINYIVNQNKEYFLIKNKINNILAFNTDKITENYKEVFKKINRNEYFYPDLYATLEKSLEKNNIDVNKNISCNIFNDDQGEIEPAIIVLPIRESFINDEFKVYNKNSFLDFSVKDNTINKDKENYFEIIKRYFLIKYLKDDNEYYCVSNKLNFHKANYIFGIYPNFIMDNWKIYYLFTCTPSEKFDSIKPKNIDIKESNISNIQKKGYHITNYKIDSFPEILECFRENNSVGFIVTKKPQAINKNNNKKINVGIDFGSTSTNIFLSEGVENSEPYKLQIEKPRIINIIKTNEEDTIKNYKYFLPSNNSQEVVNMKIPFLSILNNFNYDKNDIFLGKNIFYQSKNLESLKEFDLNSNLKWNLDTTDNINQLSKFLSQTLLQLFIELVFNGYFKINLSYSFPSSFGGSRIATIKDTWNKLISYYSKETSLDIKIDNKEISESEASSIYFVSSESYMGVNPEDGFVIIDIGGSTSDISLIYNNQLQKYFSLKFAGRNILMDLFEKQENKSFIKDLFQNDNSDNKDLENIIQEFEKSEEKKDFYTYLDTIFKLGSSSISFPKILNLKKYKEIVQYIYLSLGFIFFYIGLSISKDPNRDKIKSFCIGGNGAKILNWIACGDISENNDVALHKDLAMNFLETFFIAGLFDYAEEFNNIIKTNKDKYSLDYLLSYENINKDDSIKSIFDAIHRKVDDREFRVYISKSCKEEVAKGLIYPECDNNRSLLSQIKNSNNKPNTNIISGENFQENSIEMKYNDKLDPNSKIDIKDLNNTIFTLLLFSSYFINNNKKSNDIWIKNSELITNNIKIAKHIPAIISDIKNIIRGYTEDTTIEPVYILAIKKLLKLI